MKNTTIHQRASRLASADAAVSLILIATSLAFLFYLVPEYIVEPRRLQSPLLSPLILPQIMGWLILLLSIGLVLGMLFGPERARVESNTRLRDLPVRQWLLPILAFAVYYFGFEPIGAAVCGVLATMLLFIAMDVRRIGIYLLGVAMPVGICLAFDYGLNVPLPYGSLWGY
ncbi:MULTISPECIES: tripartite tricarboxylate transporter TctB family protein [Stutzerimonas]|uniref:tripartite tricarboxylate transporter TctB family protein n=1 Tax=Stutzerimonas TaxID=2901164 RepID=UPI00210C6D32|nr:MULTISPECIES: tripartite tricarboxylate transporter TctB family protein [Stutzerimonas]MCQ4293262.1 tripartite tricarboxylate transporter TctB family protein [Stutzerimonas stutzeri]WOF80869.1 tripartite tricarboxylate transporter TctB family protein [Pseudomonas sp. FeN3W]|tara:strand:- start:2240 stop:2752 length:513 start_codon:yes stop_codon:yes gene_type:complete